MGTPHFLRQGLDPEFLESPSVFTLSVGLKASMSFLTDVLGGELLMLQSLAPGVSSSRDGMALGSRSALLGQGCSSAEWGLHFCKMLLS